MDTINLLENFLSETALAAQLVKCVRTIQRWRQLGIGPTPTMIGDRPMYSIDDVKAWLREQRKVPPARRRARRRAA